MRKNFIFNVFIATGVVLPFSLLAQSDCEKPSMVSDVSAIVSFQSDKPSDPQKAKDDRTVIDLYNAKARMHRDELLERFVSERAALDKFMTLLKERFPLTADQQTYSVAYQKILSSTKNLQAGRGEFFSATHNHVALLDQKFPPADIARVLLEQFAQVVVNSYASIVDYQLEQKQIASDFGVLLNEKYPETPKEKEEFDKKYAAHFDRKRNAIDAEVKRETDNVITDSALGIIMQAYENRGLDWSVYVPEFVKLAEEAGSIDLARRFSRIAENKLQDRLPSGGIYSSLMKADWEP